MSVQGHEQSVSRVRQTVQQGVHPSAWDLLQDDAMSRLLGSIQAGNKQIVATGPTGFGKTIIAERLINWAVARNMPWVFYTHRKQLFAQTQKKFVAAGIHHGCRAADYKDVYAPDRPGQIAMFPTEMHAVKLQQTRDLHLARLVIVDEAHAAKSGWPEEVIRWHLRTGAIVVGLSATPVNLGHLYKTMVVLSTNSQLRKVGGILPCITYGPDEVDISGVGKIGEEYIRSQLGERFAVTRVFGRVLENYHRLNPQQRPALLFAPGVKESVWFCDQFNDAGVKAASIDGGFVCVDGQEHRTTQNKRDEVIQRFVDGEIKVICNRFVFREGVDIPQIYHGIFATSFGTEEGWVQSGGRILRSHPSLDHVIIQDHGGNWYRQHSLNADRDWSIEDTSASRVKSIREPVESGEKKQDKCCPNCDRIIYWPHWKRNGEACPYCQFKFHHSRRSVIEINGELKKIVGDPVKRKKVSTTAHFQKAWDSIYYPSKNSKSEFASNFLQLRARFHKKFPRYTVNIDMGRGETTVFDSVSGTESVLKNAPEPGSAHWSMKAKQVQQGDLQQGGE